MVLIEYTNNTTIRIRIFSAANNYLGVFQFHNGYYLISNTEEDLRGFLIDVTNNVAQITPEELNAIIPADQSI